MTAAVGFNGGVAVTLEGDARDPAVVDRRTVPIRLGQPYHEASRQSPRTAEETIRKAQTQARRRARDGLGAIVATHPSVAAVGLLLSPYEGPPTLAATLRSHPACHAAEGQMNRDAVVAAAASLGLHVAGVLERDAERRLSVLLGVDGGALAVRLNDIGRAVGAPWRRAEKMAAAVAWLALDGATR